MQCELFEHETVKLSALTSASEWQNEECNFVMYSIRSTDDFEKPVNYLSLGAVKIANSITSFCIEMCTCVSTYAGCV